jgi:hypothetical protein
MFFLPTFDRLGRLVKSQRDLDYKTPLIAIKMPAFYGSISVLQPILMSVLRYTLGIEDEEPYS